MIRLTVVSGVDSVGSRVTRRSAGRARCDVYTPPQLERIEAQAFRRQQMAFCVLTACVFAALLALHTQFGALLGEPPRSVVGLLLAGTLMKAGEWYWLWRKPDGISARATRVETAVSSICVFALAWTLTVLTDRDDAPYFVLLAVPILQCAYHFGLKATIATIVASIGMIFEWAHHFFTLHPPPRPTEFLESGMISVIYTLMGLLVCSLVRQVDEKERRLIQKMTELDSTRERLASEEKLAAVGRLAAGVAHEIRNPVAMIVSSLGTATDSSSQAMERDEMFAIASREARRLENLTNDFLTYARPSPPQRTQIRCSEILDHIASMTRLRGSEKRINVFYELGADPVISVDPYQVEAALVNIAMNAVTATPAEGAIHFAFQEDATQLSFAVKNSGERIPEAELTRIFEPFFTTKHWGTGLGLAISRGVARAHGGDLWVSKNEPGAVEFTLSLDLKEANVSQEELFHG
ncbi:hypothetical protein DYQ86_09735 [Acidobacteria bacterium AB60]|nr:hypothetical protein DYQ86_09735 [Acidobacteria bacterium AB60]